MQEKNDVIKNIAAVMRDVVKRVDCNQTPKFVSLSRNCRNDWEIYQFPLTLLHSERLKTYAILAFLSAIGFLTLLHSECLMKCFICS